MAYLNAPGAGLPFPQNLYPSELFGAPQDWGNGQITLAAASAITIPRGSWLVDTGLYSAIQFNDPNSPLWRTITPNRRARVIQSDGFNYRIQNLLGVMLGGVVTALGSGYAQSTTLITPSTGNSTWQPIVGGALAVGSIVNAGANYSIPPIVAIPSPPADIYNGIGGIQATAYSALSSGTVSGVTLTNFGAGYTQATVTALLLPSTFDPNFASITIGSVTFTISGSAGKLTAGVPTTYGSAVATTASLTVSGAGSSATIVPLIGQTVLSVSVTAAGAGYGSIGGPLVTSSGGGNTNTDVVKNPIASLDNFVPLPFQGLGVLASGSLSSVTIYDGGFFISAPNPIILPVETAASTQATIAFTMGSTVDTIFLQPMGGT